MICGIIIAQFLFISCTTQKHSAYYLAYYANKEEVKADNSIEIPGSAAHHYGAFILLNYYTLNDIKVTYIDDDDSPYVVNLSKCLVAGPYLLIPEILRPGYTLKIYHKTTEKKMQEEHLPSLNSSLYSNFVEKTNSNLAIASSFLSPNGYSGGYNSGNSYQQGGTTTYRACHGRGKCGTCNGTGYYQGFNGTGTLKCPNCSESNGRICTVCNGTGKWNL